MRIQKLQKSLKEEKLDGLIVTSPKDLFYLTGLQISTGILFVTKSKATLFVDGRYFEACKKMKHFETELLKGNSFYEFLKKIKGLKRLGFDNQIPYAQFSEFSSQLPKKWALIPISGPLNPLRVIKEKEEIKALKKASDLNKRAFLYAKGQLREGLTEFEMASKLMLFFFKEGGEKLSFDPIVAFGENSAYPHHRPSKLRKLKKGDTVLIDMGITLDHYNSDCTRVYFFGPANKKIKEIYKIVLKALKEALAIAKPGVSLFDLDKAARQVIEKAGYGSFFPHSLGHGVGLEVHEFPRVVQNETTKNILLKPGMVITIEPGIYLPNLGGVRLEELILITKNGYENLNGLKDL